ncbi:MAG: MarR family transcriptional regulator [Sandarakinorhabdus sp.]|nr:MarR family transcriptional regulator [Sandarakinorhabdus sp.]
MHDYPMSDPNVSAGLQTLLLAAGRAFPVADSMVRVRSADGDLLEAVRAEQPDILLMTASLASPELAALLAERRHAHTLLIVEARDEDADRVGLLLGCPLHILQAPASANDIAAAVADAVRSVGAGDATNPFSPEDRIAALKRDADRVAAAIAELAAGRSGEGPRPIDPARIRTHIKARRARNRFFAVDLFADPAWDMLLDLSAARMEGRRVSVSSLCIAAAVPTTTALRWIKTLIDRDLFVRESDPADARRAFIGMTPATVNAMQACLEAVLNHPGQ